MGVFVTRTLGNTVVSNGSPNEAISITTHAASRTEASLTRTTRSSNAPARIRTEERSAHSARNQIVVILSSPYELQSFLPAAATALAQAPVYPPAPPTILPPIHRKIDQSLAGRPAPPRCAAYRGRGRQKCAPPLRELRSLSLPGSARWYGWWNPSERVARPTLPGIAPPWCGVGPQEVHQQLFQGGEGLAAGSWTVKHGNVIYNLTLVADSVKKFLPNQLVQSRRRSGARRGCGADNVEPKRIGLSAHVRRPI